MPLKSKLEIIEEIAAYYSEDVNRRGWDAEKEECLYHLSDTKKCAIGYCLKDSSKFREVFGTIDDALKYKSITLEDFKEEYRIKDNSFWQDLQDFHDISKHWDSEGLTELGRETLKSLKLQYAETPVT